MPNMMGGQSGSGGMSGGSSALQNINPFGAGTGAGNIWNPVKQGPGGAFNPPQSSTSPNAQPTDRWTAGSFPGIPGAGMGPSGGVGANLSVTQPNTYQPSTYKPGQEQDEQMKRRQALDALMRGS